MAKGFVAYFKKLDQLSDAPALTVNGSPRFTTTSGAFFTSLAYFTVAIYALLQLFTFSSFNIKGTITTTLRLKENPEVDFQTHRILPIVTAVGPTVMATDLLKVYSAQIIVNLGEKTPNGDLISTAITTLYIPCDTIPADLLRKYYPSELIKVPEIRATLDRKLCVNIVAFEEEFSGRRTTSSTPL